jgi:hypothetical protein
MVVETRQKCYLDIHGLIISLEAEDPQLVSWLLRPFRYFQRNHGEPLVRISVKQEEPPYNELPQVEAAFFTPRNVVYQDTDRKIIDYFGKGIVFQNGNGSYEICGEEQNFLNEAFYLLTLSLLGQYCDRKGMLRIHALALSCRDHAALILLPQGGGKSTLAMSMMSLPEIRYISDDDPIFNPSGEILPFPRPLGILNLESLSNIPPEYIYSVDRMEFGKKFYVDCDFWKDKIETRNLKQIILISAKRVLNGQPSVHSLSRFRIFKILLRDAVIGIGLYQGMEFLFQSSSWDVLSKLPVFFKRLRRAVRLTLSSDPYLLVLGNDVCQNAQVLQQFLLSHEHPNP